MQPFRCSQDHDALVAAFREEIAGNKIDVILDYLWGAPAEAALAAIAKKGLDHASARIRYIQIGNSAGPNISLPAAILRSSGLELLGSGFGSVEHGAPLRFHGGDSAGSSAKAVRDCHYRPPHSATSSRCGLSKTDARLVFQP